MSDMVSYSKNCDFIVKEFALHKEANIYDMFNAMTDGYRNLKDELLVAQASNEVNLKQEKKRGRPKNRTAGN